MANFSNDAHLLKWEPDVFRLCRFPQQKLGGGSHGATWDASSIFRDIISGEFVNAGVDAGHVIYLFKSEGYDDYLPVESRMSITQLELDAPAGIFVTQTDIAWSIHTFDPQHEEARFELMERFDADGPDDEDEFKVRLWRRASVFRVLEIIFRSQASSEDDLFWKKAERYRVLFERTLGGMEKP